MAISHILLGLLTRGERYGYQMRRELEDELGSDWRLDFGQLYRVLRKMESDGLVAVHTKRQGHGPPQKIYKATRRGQVAFKRWLLQPVPSPGTRGRDELPAKLHFAGDAAGGLIAARKQALADRQQEEHRRCESARHGGDPRRWLAAEARRQHAEAALVSLTTCEPMVRHIRTKEDPAAHELVAIGSDDLVLDLLAQQLTEHSPAIRFATESVGSLAGLLALREGRAHLAGIHLLDVDSGKYNAPFVRHLLPEERILLVNLAHREQGLMLAAGNPKGIRGLRGLLKPGVRLINRQAGAGTRLLLFQRLRRARIDPQSIDGYNREATTHSAVAAAIAAGTADAGPGIRAAAKAWGLDFIPLGEERYDLAIPRRIFDSPQLRPLLEALHTKDFRRAAASLDGYDVTQMSRIVADLH